MYKKRGRKNKQPTKELFEHQYYVLGMTGEEMAKLYEVKPSTIYNWAVEFRKQKPINRKEVMIKKVIRKLANKQIFIVNKKEN